MARNFGAPGGDGIGEGGGDGGGGGGDVICEVGGGGDGIGEGGGGEVGGGGDGIGEPAHVRIARSDASSTSHARHARP